MKVLKEDKKAVIIQKLVLIPLVLYPIVDFYDSVDILLAVCLAIALLVTPPLRNIGLSPRYESVDEQGLHKIYFWGIKKRLILWKDVSFTIVKKKIFICDSRNDSLIALLGSYTSLDNLELIMNYINTDHPDYSDLSIFFNNYQKISNQMK